MVSRQNYLGTENHYSDGSVRCFDPDGNPRSCDPASVQAQQQFYSQSVERAFEPIPGVPTYQLAPTPAYEEASPLSLPTPQPPPGFQHVDATISDQFGAAALSLPTPQPPALSLFIPPGERDPMNGGYTPNDVALALSKAGVIGGALGGIGGFIVGGPAGALAGAKVGSSVGEALGGGGGATGPGGLVSSGPCGSGFTLVGTNCVPIPSSGLVGSPQCPPGQVRVGTMCVNLGGALPGGQPFTTQVGAPMAGRFGVAFAPTARNIGTLKCPPGMVLGKDNMCYDRLPKGYRKWNPGTKPLITGGEINALRKVDRIRKRVKKAAKSVDLTTLTPAQRAKIPKRRKR